MSLLMDALKKAEQEKKEAAKKRELDTPDDTGMHLQQKDSDIKDTDKTDTHEIQDQPPQNSTQDNQSAATDNQPLADLSLTPLDSGGSFESGGPQAAPAASEPDIAQTGTEPLPSVEAADITHTSELPLQEAAQEIQTTAKSEAPEVQPALEADPDQTFHGVSLEKTYTAELYEDTVQGEPFKPEEFTKSYDETLPGVPAAQLAKDIGTQDQPTPVAAQTVFSATNTIAKPSSGFRWLLIGLAALAVLSALVASYFFITPVSRDIPSPIVARGIETIITPPVNVTPAAPIPTPQTPPSPQADVGEPAEVVETGSIPEAVIADQIVIDDGAVASETGIAEETQTVTEPVAMVDYGQQDMISGPAESLPEVIEPPTSMIKITRSRQPDQDNQLIREAFAAYKNKDYAMAQLMYSDALKQYPENRDALLGMAAVALQTGRQDEAMNYYLQLLRKNPLDDLARVAVLGQLDGNNTLSSISQLKTMISISPNQPFLFFTLGKLHARRGDWSEAQRAFFDAYRLDTSNPDFALNLAISLDRLGQTQPALDYYNVAVSLAESSQVNFETSIVQDRIKTLTNGN